VHPVTKNFWMVAKIKRDRKGKEIIISNKRGTEVKAPVNWKFLYD